MTELATNGAVVQIAEYGTMPGFVHVNSEFIYEDLQL